MFTKIKAFFAFSLLTMLVSITSNIYASDFAIKEVQVKSSKVLEVSFTNDLAEKSDELSEFMITKKSDNTQELKIESLETISANTLKINLSFELEPSTEYDLTAIFVADSEGAVLENGASGIVTFKTPEIFSSEVSEKEVVQELNSASEEVVQELNSFSEEVVKEITKTSSEEVSKEENMTQSVEEVSKEENMTEVKTGTQEILLIFLSLLLAFLFISVRRKS